VPPKSGADAFIKAWQDTGLEAIKEKGNKEYRWVKTQQREIEPRHAKRGHQPAAAG
jgi:hypothetical protein